MNNPKELFTTIMLHWRTPLTEGPAGTIINFEHLKSDYENAVSDMSIAMSFNNPALGMIEIGHFFALPTFMPGMAFPASGSDVQLSYSTNSRYCETIMPIAAPFSAIAIYEYPYYPDWTGEVRAREMIITVRGAVHVLWYDPACKIVATPNTYGVPVRRIIPGPMMSMSALTSIEDISTSRIIDVPDKQDIMSINPGLARILRDRGKGKPITGVIEPIPTK